MSITRVFHIASTILIPYRLSTNRSPYGLHGQDSMRKQASSEPLGDTEVGCKVSLLWLASSEPTSYSSDMPPCLLINNSSGSGPHKSNWCCHSASSRDTALLCAGMKPAYFLFRVCEVDWCHWHQLHFKWVAQSVSKNTITFVIIN